MSIYNFLNVFRPYKPRGKPPGGARSGKSGMKGAGWGIGARYRAGGGLGDYPVSRVQFSSASLTFG
mgnify:CR=1 FL=1